MFRRTARPTAVHVLDTRTAAPSAYRSNHIYCPPARTVCFRHSSHAIFAP